MKFKICYFKSDISGYFTEFYNMLNYYLEQNFIIPLWHYKEFKIFHREIFKISMVINIYNAEFQSTVVKCNFRRY